ncbi:MAG: 8-amino-7-oxononanoate synthase [Thermodesulfovibrionales bacterium]
MFLEKLEILKKENLLRYITDRDSAQGPGIVISGKEYINFASNDYLGLAGHAYIREKARNAIDFYGFGAGASRLLGGGCALHKELEERTALFKGTEAALVFNSGYAANAGILPSIADKDFTIFSDELNHASIIDGCRLSGAKLYIYRHKDLSHLGELIEKGPSGKKLVVTDTVFSMGGDIAPLEGIYEICRNNGTLLYIDDAHGTGVLGNGKGALSHFQIRPEPWIIQMGTFSKALGSYGAFVAGSSAVIQWILNTARSFVFSTALPPCIVAGSLAGLELVEHNSEPLFKLRSNREKLANSLSALGFDIMGSETPIIPIKTGTIKNTLRISRRLFEKGIYAPAIRPPTVKTPRIRITVTAVHTDEDIERLIEALGKV